MAEEALHVVELRDDFYRDSFGKVIFIIASIIVSILLMVMVAVYLYLKEPPPVVFPVDAEWRVQPAVPLTQPYLSEPDLLQWVSDVIPRSFIYDFSRYNDQLKQNSQYFTADGWRVFLNQLNNYANYNTVQTNKMFVNGVPAGAPFILNQGLLSGRYAWWIQMPITINYIGNNRTNYQNLTLQILVVRVSTLNNLIGVGIDNVVVSRTPGQLIGNG